MNRMLRGLAIAVVVTSAAVLPTGASQILVSSPPPMVLDADPDHPVLGGGVAAVARAHGERAEILAVVRPQATVEANRTATDRLAARLRIALPGFVVTSEPSTTTARPDGLQLVDGVEAGGAVRVAVPGPLRDATLRAVVDRTREALDTAPWPGLVAGASINAVSLGIASCAELDRSGEADALGAVAGMARAFGDDAADGTGLRDRTARPVGGRGDDPLCGRDAHVRISPHRGSLTPTSVTAIENRRYAFRRGLPRLAGSTAAAGEPYVPGPAVAYGAWADARVRVRTRGPVLTVAGYAPAHVTYAAARYVWSGPNGRYRASDIRVASLDAARRRLRALAIHDDAIVTQLDPRSGTLFVEVHTPDGARRDDIVAAIAGDSEAERRAVRFMRDRATCAPRGEDVRAAFADAAARARDVTRALGTTADLAHPIAIDVLSFAVGPCIVEHSLPYDDRVASRHVTGSLALAGEDGIVGLTATFAIGAPQLGGGSAAQPLAAPIDENVLRYQLAPPPIDYPAATSNGEARASAALDATHLLVTTRFDPDSEHGFRNVDAAVPIAFAAQIGATAATSMTALAAIPSYANENAEMNEWQTTALLGARPGLLDTVVAANADANRYGNVSTDVLAERRSCGAAPLALAVRAIRSAAAAAKNGDPRRLVAIDLSGPFAVSGRCSVATAVYGRGDDVRHATPTVHLAAYARVSYR